ncbi:LUD domain-containing protein [Vogesella sp. LIG4]|uniref:LutC/YkgG family protein n=1 Tax=Vogesella sp. LIG4 TaxID=1192162 RepID=UPI00081F9767|nr:LUD domain-containing protein [Vogesella sp. LIG4]SCK07107.1 L-lactate dehydrogenase complex protein LldG [Vogesella sp. LIG4]
MSSREQILAKLRQNRPQGPALPDIHAVPFIRYDDKLAAFAGLIRNLGGEAITLAAGQSVLDAVQQRWPQHGRLADLTTATPEQVASPHDWQDVDVAIIPGQLAVAENAAVWVSNAGNDWRSIYFLTQKLVLVVPRDAIVDTMRDAYSRIDIAEHGFGAFISGSSRTADIEQSLVMGAHGAMAALVIFA